MKKKGANCPLVPGSGYDVSYNYDAGTNGKGRRTSMSVSGGDLTVWTYDERGRVITEGRQIPGGGQFFTDFTYNSADLPVTMTYPDDEVVAFTYNSKMLPTSVIGNGLTQTFNYYAWNQEGGRLHTLTAGTLQNLLYQYDTVGNITQITNSIAGETSVYEYDALDRLTSWQLNQDNPETYAYDSAGRLDQKDSLDLQYLDSNHVHAVTNANTNTYVYDNNGNQTTRTFGSDHFDLVYDAENRLVEVQKNDATIALFTFDGDGTRVMSVMNGETIHFVGGYYELKGIEITKYYMAGAARVAMRKYTIPQSMTVEYMLGDHLGSTSITTDSNGALVSEMRYKPWGEVRYHWVDEDLTTTPAYTLPKFTFTGQYSYMDDPYTQGVVEGFGLMYFNTRWMDPSLGRFTQADTMIPPGIQGYDRYAYVGNNPIRYTDPTGHKLCDEEFGCSGFNSNGNSGDKSKNNLVQKDEANNNGEDIVYPNIVGPGWTTEEITAIYVAWLLLIQAFGSQAALLEALGGPITLMHTPMGLLGKNVVAKAFEPLNTIFVDSRAFLGTKDHMTWYALHEIGHIFDENNAYHNPSLYKSNSFVQAFVPSGCGLISSGGCTGSQWNPTDSGTTGYGLSNSQEDFADSFASTILYNNNAPGNMTFMNVSPDRMNIINTWISIYAQ